MTTTLPIMDSPLSSQFHTHIICCKGKIDRKRAVIWENEQKAWQEKNYLSCLGNALFSRIVNLSCLLTTPIDLCYCTLFSACSIYDCIGGRYCFISSCFLLPGHSAKEADEFANTNCALSVNSLALASLSCAHASVQTCCFPTNLLCPEMYNRCCLERIDLSLNQQEYHKINELETLLANIKLARNSASTTTQVTITGPIVTVME